MQSQGDQAARQDDQASWWFKLLTRGVGTVGGIGKQYLSHEIAN